MQKEKLKEITDLLAIEQSDRDSILSFDLPDDKSEYLKNCSHIFDNQDFEPATISNSLSDKVVDFVTDINSKRCYLQNGFTSCNFENGITSSKIYDVFEAIANSSKSFSLVCNFDGSSQINNVEVNNLLRGVHPDKTLFCNNKFSVSVDKNQKAVYKFLTISDSENPACQIAVTNIVVKSGAKFDLHLLNNINNKSSFVHRLNVTIEDNCEVKISNCNFNGKFVQTILNVNMIGEGSTLSAPGISMPTDNQVFDYLSFINHKVSNCTSNQKIRAIANGNGYSNFYGLVKVAQDAQKTQSDQVNNNILLSETAKIESKPQLEIYADDVKCSHGSTTGMLDSEAIFYMRSRGISEKAAQGLLIQAFTQEIVNEIDAENYGEVLNSLITQKLI